MKNIFTFTVESWVGALLLGVLAVFFIIMLFTMISNFSSDVDILSSSYSTVQSGKNKTNFISPFEKSLINSWLHENGIVIPEGKSYHYLLEVYPERPWLETIE